MTLYSYSAKKISGEEINGQEDTENQFTLAESLRKKGYMLVSFKKKSALPYFSLNKLTPKRSVSMSEKMIFSRNLSVMVGAGVALTRGLEVLTRQTTNAKFKEVIGDLSDNIRRGKPLSEAMSEHPKIFSRLFVAMIKAGETSGNLEESLLLIAGQLEREYDLRRKVRGAFIYPVIILISMAVIGVIMMMYVVPTLVSTFEELGIELPLSTRIMLATSNFLTNNIFITIFMIAGLAIVLRIILKNDKVSDFVSGLTLRIPIISGLVKKINAARTARTFGSLLGAGVEILEALDVTENVIQNPRFKKVIRDSKTDIQKGNTVSKSFIENQDLFPLLVGEMMAVGEETGKLSKMLERLASFYEQEVDAQTKNISTIIEPFLMIIIGIVVGFFAFSMITPLYSSMAGL
ncbi:MAG: hypothetical protein COU46_02895 [Candidatus Niyogibacteria bacterium CG10_big_fil_rev_8_21_14_0_10_42_19]|uniref:Type II secretion system protein GspF domain-containing protein n=1 Tax=Candidatus Niyogibacteria bacterium CG10_big_fil_rev_8_21_14_0_10_42_19 TaxID=1974725 RepID=A0A2H0TF70_9BACT|nr:MAG: hypothetical protein COU46_02895 [Candidatus Niyogibacteria bacterium CG10_big_fil_rev_8_21_14_0_10_42_19]